MVLVLGRYAKCGLEELINQLVNLRRSPESVAASFDDVQLDINFHMAKRLNSS